MKFGIILETKEPEKAWNAFRFATTAKKGGHEVKVFLMGEAVECESLTHEKYDVAGQLKAYADAGGEILACGTCLKSRQMAASDTCPISTMIDCVKMVEWAERLLPSDKRPGVIFPHITQEDPWNTRKRLLLRR